MIKHMVAIALTLSAVFMNQSAAAFDHGDRMERRWDQRGDAIDSRLDARFEHQETLGQERRANQLDHQGDRIDARFDRIGQRRKNHFDRRTS